MKYFLRTILFFSLCLGPFTAAIASSLPLRLEDLTNQLSSPANLVNWMKENIHFEDDTKIFKKEDYWQSPAEFLQHRTGDCEDYALFAKYILGQLKIEAYVVSVYNASGYAHTVTIYQDGKFYNVINQDRLIQTKAETIEEAVSSLHSEWTWAAVAEEKNKRGWLVFSFENPQPR